MVLDAVEDAKARARRKAEANSRKGRNR